MKKKNIPVPCENIDSVIQTVRGQKIILDADLARIYGIPVFRFNEAVKRNADRFPEDFRFQLIKEEWEAAQRLRSQIAILDTGRGRHRKYLPYAFTEHGAIMAANVLNNPQAVQGKCSSCAFLKMRSMFADARSCPCAGRPGSRTQGRLNVQAAIVDVLRRIVRLLDPPRTNPSRRSGKSGSTPEDPDSGAATGTKPRMSTRSLRWRSWRLSPGRRLSTWRHILVNQTTMKLLTFQKLGENRNSPRIWLNRAGSMRSALNGGWFHDRTAFEWNPLRRLLAESPFQTHLPPDRTPDHRHRQSLSALAASRLSRDQSNCDIQTD
jgi:hypothetical protein